MTFLFFTALAVAFILYNRYFPVFGAFCTNVKDLNLDEIKVIDVRDFNDSYKNPINGAVNIPLAYLKRNFNEIPSKDIHLVVSNPLEKNIGIRFLRKKGFRVVGYTIIR
ncbi:hypothetical protein J7E79_22495 [Bacillus sp. ISL-40]|uniref:hypothetical protein n=1 Tax=unclassified Bacillus (in: firmicutes) TaxID=185979 RepID=UPI001BECB0A1|nr:MULTISPECIES: hypothetical protein [unclassified Bacillus (in: firmicutes)]MBT2700140.1 hypothetical protein [Bacillus sp. ISL-40]MBT2744662.1 hypothetical protein [Bacillus sp. ISL-77]